MKELVSQSAQPLRLSGSPSEIGRLHGEAAKEKVLNSLETYEKLFLEFTGIGWKAAQEKAKLHLNAIEQYGPHYLEEMEGLARGAGVAFEDILVLNARSEIALTTAPDGCTSFALTRPKTEKTWLAQNWDWKGSQLGSLVHVQIEQAGKPLINMVTEAGIIGKIGCNSEGIGVCLNALTTNLWEPKVPIHLGLRAVLESATFEEAVSRVADDQMASPAHFLIASDEADGTQEGAASMEVSPVRTARLSPTDGVLVHTNHLCSGEMKQEMTELILPDSFRRLNAITQQVGELSGEDSLEAEDLFHLLANHENYPNSICRHDSPEQTVREKMETVFSVVMNLTDRELTWIEGKPCAYY